ncbi:MAG: DnaJ C-terminal domain-containing protein [Planctomycetaceae bacterium]
MLMTSSSAFGDLFEGFGFQFGGSGSGGGRRGGGRAGATRGESLQATVRIDLPEAYNGCKRELRITRHEGCDTCQGSGCKPGSSPTKCSTCGGHGQVIQSQGFFRFQTSCPACRGRGTVVKDSCVSCNGQGRIMKEVVREVTIPAGVDSGMQLCLRGEGEAGLNGGPRGDLYVDIEVKKHPLFQRDGQDLTYRLPVTIAQASLGAEIEIPTLKGRETLKIKPGTQPGEVNRLRGMGMPDPRGANGRVGDLLVEVQVEIPRKLSAEQEDLLRKLAELDHKNVMPQRKSFFEQVKAFFSGENSEEET